MITTARIVLPFRSAHPGFPVQERARKWLARGRTGPWRSRVPALPRARVPALPCGPVTVTGVRRTVPSRKSGERTGAVSGAGRGWSRSGPFDASIFDLDGLLVDSEPLWHQAEVEVLGNLGAPITSRSPRGTKGMFVGEVTRHWYERHPWSGPSPEAVAHQVVDRVIELVEAGGELKPGVAGAVELCRSRGLLLAVASSSEHRLIDVVLARFGLDEVFAVRRSAEDEEHGKPHPAVFLSAASALGAAAERCLVWEDAPAGVLAAKAARMTCVAVPSADGRGNPAFGIADAVLSSLEEADDALWDRLVSAWHASSGVGGREPAGPA